MYSVEIGVGALSHIIVDDNVHPININSSTKDVGSYHDPLFKIFELIESLDSIYIYIYIYIYPGV